MKWTYDKNIHTGVKWTYYFLSNTVTVTRSKTILTLVRWYYPHHSPYKYFDLWYANSINNIDIIKINYMTLFHDESSSITLMSPIFMILIYWQVKKVWFRINLKVLIYTHTPPKNLIFLGGLPNDGEGSLHVGRSVFVGPFWLDRSSIRSGAASGWLPYMARGQRWSQPLDQS